jgi:cobalamin biosynthesis protein CobD/CbiB
MQCIVVTFYVILLGLDSVSTHRFMYTVGDKRVKKRTRKVERGKGRKGGRKVDSGCMLIQICTFVCMFLCTYVCTYVHVHVWLYVCTCVCVCAYLPTGRRSFEYSFAFSLMVPEGTIATPKRATRVG